MSKTIINFTSLKEKQDVEFKLPPKSRSILVSFDKRGKIKKMEVVYDGGIGAIMEMGFEPNYTQILDQNKEFKKAIK